LIDGDTQPLVDLLQLFFAQLSARAVQSLDESALQTTLEAFWFESSKHNCITQLCLLADPKATYGNGRYKFADMFIPGSNPTNASICLELKNVPLIRIWHGKGRLENVTGFRREIAMMPLEDLLHLKVKYNQQGLPDATIQEIIDYGTQQVMNYLELIQFGKNGPEVPQRKGIIDNRVECRRGTSNLLGYVVIAIGATRVVVRKVVEHGSKYTFEATDK
jgi:hypothetical protein